jgi:D-serine deaminase-like pyridoxal phosphate-dependent protein
VANEVVDDGKLRRLVALAGHARMALAVDDPEPVGRLARLAEAAGETVDVLIDVDILLHRCGVAEPEEAVRLAEAISRFPTLHLRGIMGYEGRVRLDYQDRAATITHAYAILAMAREALESAGFAVEVVSSAGTSTLSEALADPTITEVQAGVYALMEPELLNLGLPFQCAVSVRGTVISRHPGRFVLDIGRRAVGMEYGPPAPIGFTATEIAVSDEHLRISTRDSLPDLGGQVDVRPGQIRTTFNLHDTVWATRGEQIIERWPISARGSSQ